MRTSQKSILIIENNKEMLDNTAEILALANYEVLKVEAAEQGHEILSCKNPDLIIIDALIQSTIGFQLLQNIDKIKYGKPIPLIILSISNEKITINDNVDGFTIYYLMKPFNGEDLLKMVSDTLYSTAVSPL
jgi:DNA-binding response OmpR family regulator